MFNNFDFPPKNILIVDQSFENNIDSSEPFITSNEIPATAVEENEEKKCKKISLTISNT